MKKISLVETLCCDTSSLVGVKVESENVLGKVTDIGVFEGTSLAYIDTGGQIHVLPQQELWFRVKKK